MAGKKNSKLKLLYLKEIFEKYSDEDNILNSADIAHYLEEYEIECERKSIYKDIEILIDYGMDIIKTSKPKTGYFLASRDFEIAELRLINDAVQAANFISKKKTVQLLKKTNELVSVSQSSRLKKQVFIDNRNKCTNEEIFYNIDALDRAIKSGKKVKLRYNRRKLDNKFTATNEQREFILSPYALIWSNDHYYLVANNQKYDNLMNMRIDRIRKVELLDENFRHFSEVSEYTSSFDAADYVSKAFNMFSGKLMSTELHCRTEIIEEMLDRFGEKVSIRKGEEGWFYVHDDLYINDGLASWIMQFGDKIEVIYPPELKQAILEKSNNILKLYSAY
ncbi:MAG: WYL domain-containing transcriptional regulator [Clostridia bacterium]|nr:WYL domain-containing transcriptional regulator [Clostridia bacterium]